MATEKEDIEYRRQVVEKYKPDVEKLIRYLPWLEDKAGKDVSTSFEGSGIKEHSIPFPVYDGTLMSFVKEAQRTKMINRNYVYVYSKYQIKTMRDELLMIEKADITKMEILEAVLSKYILTGMTKGNVWTQGVTYGVFLKVISKMKSNIEFWDVPMR